MSTSPILDRRHFYTPRGSLLAAFKCRDDELLVSGPAGTGKSMALLEKMHAVMLANPGARGLIVRKTLSALGSTALDTWRKRVVPEALAGGVLWYYGGSSEEPPQYRYENGSAVVIGGLDKPIKIMSSEYDLIYWQEATEGEKNDWESLTTRLRNGVVSFQQLMADCNPDTPTHWLKVRANEGKVRMLESRHEDNPVLFDVDGNLTEFGRVYIGRLDALTGVRKQRLRHGRWVSAEGVIYEDFDTAIHAIDQFDIPPDWPRYWTVDFGFTNPFVLQCWAEDPDGRLYLYREIYRTQRLVQDHCVDILDVVSEPIDGYVHNELVDGPRRAHHGRRWKDSEPKPRAIICDHDAEGRATLVRELGIGTTAAKKAVSLGIERTALRLRPARDGKPRIYLMRGAVVYRDVSLADSGRPASTLEEVPGYVWDTSSGKKPKEEPLKNDDHGCDAMRYIVMHRDRARGEVRFM